MILKEDFFAAHIFMYRPIPGTESFQVLVSAGELTDEQYAGYRSEYSSYADCVYAPKGMTPDELKKIHSSINRRFYLHPRRFFRILMAIKSPANFYFFVKRAFMYLGLTRN
jgi:hypothetical protein